MTIIYAVVYDNYYPLEVDSLWTTYEAARDRQQELRGNWRVQSMTLDPEDGEFS